MTPFSLLPLSWSQAIGSWLGRIIIHFNKKRLHIARCNIKTCFPNLTKEQQENLLIKNAEETGKWFAEAAYVWFRNPDRLIKKVSVKNPGKLKAAFDQQKGVVIITPHFGNWEMINFYLPQHYPFGSMYKTVKSPVMEKIILNSRTRVGTSMFSADSRGVRQALKHLKQGKVLVVLSDHLPSKKAGVYAPFFDTPAFTGKLTHSLIKHNQAEALLATVLRKPKGQGFEIEFHDVNHVHSNDPVEAATGINQSIEKAIQIAPEQYQWVYKRFSRPPEGSPNIYKLK